MVAPGITSIASRKRDPDDYSIGYRRMVPIGRRGCLADPRFARDEHNLPLACEYAPALGVKHRLANAEAYAELELLLGGHMGITVGQQRWISTA